MTDKINEQKRKLESARKSIKGIIKSIEHIYKNFENKKFSKTIIVENMEERNITQMALAKYHELLNKTLGELEYHYSVLTRHAQQRKRK